MNVYIIHNNPDKFSNNNPTKEIYNRDFPTLDKHVPVFFEIFSTLREIAF